MLDYVVDVIILQQDTARRGVVCCLYVIARILIFAASVIHATFCRFVLNHNLAIMSALLDVSKTSLFLSLGSITFNPTAWNIVARNGKPGLSHISQPVLAPD